MQKKTILIVDQNPEEYTWPGDYLQNSDFETITATSGREALNLIDGSEPSLILLDLMITDMNSLDMCRLIRDNQNWKDIPVILVGDENHKGSVVDGFRAGGTDFIIRPFGREELMARLNRHMETALYMKKVKEMNKTRERLYSIIAHDIRTPLNGIQQIINAINQGYIQAGSEEFNEIIGYLGKRTQQTNNLLNNLLHWTRMQEEAIRLDMKNTDINLIINNCIQLYESAAATKNITFDCKLPAINTSFCDEDTMYTVFRNILSNAIKFSHDSGCISINGQKDEKGISVVITDQGVGMSEKVLDKLFNKNEVHTSNGTRNESGTGLGIFIIRDFVKKNNGELNFESKQGQGTTVRVWLPGVK